MKFSWGGGGRFIGIQTHIPPKFSFSLDFGDFILHLLEHIFVIPIC